MTASTGATSNQRMVTIYGLSDPRDAVVRYVGATASRLRSRLAAHLSARGTSPAEWIAELAKEGLRPQIRELEVVTEEVAAERETYWTHHLDVGGLLLNPRMASGKCVKSGYVIRRHPLHEYPTVTVNVKINETLKGKFSEAAMADDRPLSDWVVVACMEKLERDEPTLAADAPASEAVQECVK